MAEIKQIWCEEDKMFYPEIKEENGRLYKLDKETFVYLEQMELGLTAEEQELMSELMRSVEQGKQDGSFTPEAAEAFMKKVSPMLDDAQRARMRQLMGMLKK